uniref:DUF4346 domain-containing protein n=1 Tax=Gelidium vagum TaxID=35171 RepID=A0A141SE16_GELVA|nr:hypothetical protein Gvag_079 [Gelidium vagum]AMK96534.1 hypothetical protein Gvag_079 [Gelidium vagum]
MFIHIDQKYCLITAIQEDQQIIMYYYDYSASDYPICFTSYQSSVLIYKLIYLYDDLNTLSIVHLLYLAQELYKAELSLYFKQIYIQD